MAPFPETESMTIKRLEVALRRKDMQLLKDGAYKLHEKFHTGYRFELLSELKQILEYVKTSDIPLEITEILCPTIEEILSNSGVQVPQQVQNNLPCASVNSLPAEKSEEKTDVAEVKNTTEDKTVQATEPANVQSLNNVEQKAQEEIQYKKEENTPVSSFEQQQESAGKIVLFYDDKSTDIDYTQIKNYRNKLNNLFSSQNGGDYNILKDIAVLNNIVNTRIYDLDKVLSVLKNSKSDVSFVTTSQSQDLTKILLDKEINFEIPFVKNADNSNFTFIPMLGLSDIFVCSHCNSRSLKNDSSAKTLSIQCPKCDGAAFPDLYAINSYNPDCNPIFWHRAFGAFVKSDIWVLINPPLDENKEVIFDFIKTASECSNPKRVYIFSRENDKREFYKNMFLKALPKCDIRYNYTSVEQLCEEFIRAQIAGRMNEKY